MDGRVSGPPLKHNLIQGLVSMGVDVIDIGMLPTPLLYYSLKKLNVENGLMITGSHNPSSYNGIKMVINNKTLFDEFSRGRYSTAASVYQIKPLGVVLPKDTNDVLNLMEYSQKNSIPLLARGGGSSQCGQTVGESVVLDYSKHQNKILELNVEEKYVWVQPGVVLDHLNSFLRPYGLWFPVDVSTSSRATIGGMSANNSCGSRSLYYGNCLLYTSPSPRDRG